MTKRRTFLILTVLFSLLFMALIGAGSYLISLKTQPEKQFGIAAFLFAFASAFGQMGCLAMLMRCIAQDNRAKKIAQPSATREAVNAEVPRRD